MNNTNLFEVTKLQLQTGLDGFTVPTAFGVFKKSGGQALGIVGKDYTPTQPQFLYDTFTACVRNHTTISKTEFKELKGGRRIIISAPIEEFSFKNGAKKDDVLSIQVSISTGYDGRTQTSMFISVERLICENGMKALNTEFNVQFKNVKGNLGKASMLCEDVSRAIAGIGSLKVIYQDLAKRKITRKEQRQYILKVTGMDIDKYADYSKRRQSILDQINESVAIEMKDAGDTAWALMNGITRYTNHMANFKNKEDFIYADAGMFMNNRAQHFAIELLN